MSRFDAALSALEAETGWKHAASGASGISVNTAWNGVREVAHFILSDMEFSLSAPDDRHLYFLYRLPAPEGGNPEEEPEIRARGYALMAAASARTRRTVLSFHEGVFYLHREVDLAATDSEEIPLLCQGFLNDCDWWRLNTPPGF